ncbi:MAG: hypothetical protein ACREHF_13855 [Rhizomicrobium sp.]
MLAMLHETPGVTEAKLGILGFEEKDRHPYLGYRVGRYEWVFELDPSPGPITFTASTGGLGADQREDVRITNAVTQKWKMRCGVRTSILFE